MPQLVIIISFWIRYCPYRRSLSLPRLAICSITCILFHQSIFLYSITYMLFLRLLWSSSFSTTTHIKFQSLHYHIFIFFPQYVTVSLHTSCFSCLIQRLDYAQHVHQLLAVLRSNNFTPHITRIIALCVLLKIAISLSLIFQEPCFTSIQQS